MHKFLPLLTLLLLVACGDAERPAGPALPEPDVSKATPSTAGPAEEGQLATAEPAYAVAVDEPLPPFEDDSGIELASENALVAVDSSPAISGKVLLYQAPDGSRLLRLENLQTPKDLRLSVALRRDNTTALELGRLKGPSGNMNYLIEASKDLRGVQSMALIEADSARVLASASLKRFQ